MALDDEQQKSEQTVPNRETERTPINEAINAGAEEVRRVAREIKQRNVGYRDQGRLATFSWTGEDPKVPGLTFIASTDDSWDVNVYKDQEGTGLSGGTLRLKLSAEPLDPSTLVQSPDSGYTLTSKGASSEGALKHSVLAHLADLPDTTPPEIRGLLVGLVKLNPRGNITPDLIDAVKAAQDYAAAHDPFTHAYTGSRQMRIQ